MSTAAAPRIALIHATPLAMQPVTDAFARLWPQAQRMHLLDDRLSQDLAADGGLTPAMTARMVALAQYARGCGARGILFTCSAFGPAIEEAARVVGLPTLKPNEAMFDAALDLCARLGRPARVGLLTTFVPSSVSMEEELQAAIAQRGQAITVANGCARGAMEALNAGDAATHDRLILEQAAQMAGCDVLVLGQFSMARTRQAVADATSLPTLSSPESAVTRMQQLLAGG